MRNLLSPLFCLLAAAAVLLIPACGGTYPGPVLLQTSSTALPFVASESAGVSADQTLTLFTAAGSVRSGAVSWTASSNQPWLVPSALSGTVPVGGSVLLTVHVNYQAGQWVKATSTVGAPATGHGAWTGNSLFVWSGDPAVPGTFYDPVADTWSGSASTVGAPSTRLPEEGVWTGTEVIIWGGLTAWNGTPLDTGARYNPATDTWSPMSTVGAPSARFAHMRVWTGSRMIVWGGEQPGYNYNNTGGLYDPATDTWTGATSTVNAPTPRGYSAAVWTGSRMLIWGGENPSKFDTGYLYDPATDTWTGTTTLTNALSARSHLSGVWTGSEMIVWGGGSGGPHLDTGARYNPLTDLWTGTTPLAGVPAARASFVAAWTGTEMLVWGGEHNGTLINTGGLYRPPSLAAGVHTGQITITPAQGAPLSIVVTVTVTP